MRVHGIAVQITWLAAPCKGAQHYCGTRDTGAPWCIIGQTPGLPMWYGGESILESSRREIHVIGKYPMNKGIGIELPYGREFHRG